MMTHTQLNGQDKFSFNPIFGDVHADVSFPEQPQMDRLLSISMIRPEEKNIDEHGYNSMDEHEGDEFLQLRKLDMHDFKRHSSGIRSEGECESNTDFTDVAAANGPPALKMIGTDVSDNLSFLTREQDDRISQKQLRYNHTQTQNAQLYSEFPIRGGCAARRELKAVYKTPYETQQNQEIKETKVDETLELLVLGKRRRGRAEGEYKAYADQTNSKIQELKVAAKDAESQGNKKDAKRFKNMISAYESRLLKRARAQDTQDQMNIRTQQVMTIMKILQRELRTDDLIRVTGCIKCEVPSLKPGQSLARKN